MKIPEYRPAIGMGIYILGTITGLGIAITGIAPGNVAVWICLLGLVIPLTWACYGGNRDDE